MYLLGDDYLLNKSMVITGDDWCISLLVSIRIRYHITEQGKNLRVVVVSLQDIASLKGDAPQSPFSSA